MTPARPVKHVCVNEDNNDVHVIQVKCAGAAPSTAAHTHIKTAVAS